MPDRELPLRLRANMQGPELEALAREEGTHPADVAVLLLVAHQRRDVRSCLCGWSELGRSFAKHQVDVLQRAGLLRSP